jgi:tol-pal system protein YbgF
MRKTVVYFLLILVTFMIAGCLPGVVNQRNDLEEMKRRLAVVEQSTISSQPEKALEKRIDSQATILADLRAEVDGLRVELQQVSGQYEEAANQREQLHGLLTMLRSELELKFNHLEERIVAQPAPALAQQSQTTMTTGEQGPSGAKQEYDAALKLIQKEQKFSEGRKALQRFLRDYPNHELTVNATYWIGEAYYGEKQYEKAILQFLDVIQKFPKHTKAPAALLKQGLAFGLLGEKATEKALLQQVITDYPVSPEAKKAKVLLAK